jgi:hypothetical protein
MRQWLVAIALVCAANGAGAADEPGAAACRADAQRLCQGVEAGKGRVARCLKENEAQVSHECKAHMARTHEAMRERMAAFNEACKGDVAQHCASVDPGKGRVAACLRKHETALSEPCREQLAQMDAQHAHRHARMREVAEPCKDDAQQHCAQTRPGGGRVARCLKDNEAKLSAPCREALQPR